MIGLKSYWLQPFITYSRTRLAAELLLHGKFGFRETRLSRRATVLQLAQDENIWTLHDLQSTDIFIRFDWFYKSISKKMFNRKEVGYKFFFALYHNEARPVIFGSMVTFFFNYMTNDSKQIPVHRIITMCNLISYMFIVLKRGIRTCRCLTTARKI